MIARQLLAAVSLTAASFVIAQPEVVDRQIPPAGGVPVKTDPTPQSSVGGNTAEMYYQMQLFQQELQQLRGLVEEQAYEIKKLKQQRLDDYLDLDRRLGQLGQGSAAGKNTILQTPNEQAPTPRGSESDTTALPDEMKHYRDAMNLVLKERKYDAAVVALTEHLQLYPQGRFAANAQYWLGEVYLQKNELELARDWFSRILGDFPQHSKAPDAQYKLGIIYHKLGDLTTSKNLLEKVAASDASSSRLAQDYLKTHFSK